MLEFPPLVPLPRARERVPASKMGLLPWTEGREGARPVPGTSCVLSSASRPLLGLSACTRHSGRSPQQAVLPTDPHITQFRRLLPRSSDRPAPGGPGPCGSGPHRVGHEARAGTRTCQTSVSIPLWASASFSWNRPTPVSSWPGMRVKGDCLGVGKGSDSPTGSLAPHSHVAGQPA